MHINSHARSFSAVAVVAGSVVAGCGMQGDDPLSKLEFLAQANAICESSNAELEPVFDAVYAEFDAVDWDDPANELLLFQRWDEALVEARPIIDQQLDDLGALAPPTEDEDLVDTLLADQSAAVSEFATLVGAAATGDPEALEALDSENDDPFDGVNQRAREYGLTACDDS